jgi:hypothetical protein
MRHHARGIFCPVVGHVTPHKPSTGCIGTLQESRISPQTSPHGMMLALSVEQSSSTHHVMHTPCTEGGLPMHRSLLVVVSLSVLLSTCVAAHAASYTFSTIDPPGATETYAYGIVFHNIRPPSRPKGLIEEAIEKSTEVEGLRRDERHSRVSSALLEGCSD